jgi:hypothetical protein
MRGPAIRAFQLGRALADVADVTLAGPEPSETAAAELAHVAYSPHNPVALRAPIMAADAVVAQPQWPLITSWLERSGARLIYDLSVPEPLEALERYRAQSWRARLLLAFMRDRIADALRTGHHFICAGERQRDLWLGTMMAYGRLTPDLAARDHSLRSMLAVVPYATPTEPPSATGTGGARRRFSEIEPDDEIVLWPSAIWPWFDAETAIRAIALLRDRRPRARLVFLGQAGGISADAADAAREVARELGLLDATVFFNDEWVAYDDRGDWFLEASAAVSTHFDNLETRFAFRTRLLDCFWARLPVVCTGGDELAEAVERCDAGVVVPERAAEAVADALASVLERGRGAFEPGLTALAERYTWQEAAKPLRRFVTSETLPPRLGDEGPPRRPAHVARSAAYRTGRATLAAVGASRLSRLLTAPEG